MKIGCHVSITPSVIDGLKYAVSIGCKSCQIFLGSNQSSSLKSKQKLTNIEKEEINNYIKNEDLYVSIHAIYLLNFCSYPPESARIKYAQDNLIYDLETGSELGVKCVVVHIGVRNNLDREEAYNNMANNILFILSKTKITARNIRLLLETPSGGGTQIATTTEELAELWNLILTRRSNYGLELREIKNRLGFCIDTAHIFSSGYPIRMPLGMNTYLDKFDNLIGLDKVGLIHLNDSKADLNSKRDIHEGIGDGYIFGLDKIAMSKFPIPITNKDYLQNLNTLLQRCRKSKIPALVLETHKAGAPGVLGGELYSQEIGLLKSLLEDPKWISKNPDWKLKHLEHNYLIKTLKRKSKLSNLFKKTKKLKQNNNQKQKLKQINNQKQKLKQINNQNDNIPNAQVYPTNVIIINKLKIIREYYQKIEKDSIRSLAYGKAILALKNYPEEIIYSNQLKGVKGIGSKIIKKVEEYLKNGEMNIFKERNILSRLNAYKLEEKNKISSILGFGIARTKELAMLGIYTYEDLFKEVKDGKIKLNEKEMIGVKYHKDLIKIISRDETEQIFKSIYSSIRNEGLDKKYKLEMEIAGSYPSGKEESKDIDILIFTKVAKNREELKKQGVAILDKVIEILKKNEIIIEVLSKGFGMIMCLIKDIKGIVRHLDIRLIPDSSKVFGRLFFTSGRDFNQVIRQRAKELGMLLNDMDLLDIKNGISVFSKKEKKHLTEKDIFDKLGLSYIPLTRRR